MNRRHDVNKYYETVDKLKIQRPDIALSSDFIIGFPGEDNYDFDQTMDFINKVKFTIAYSFIYSPRPGTPAANLKQINLNIKKARLCALQALLKEQQKSYNKTFVNKLLLLIKDILGQQKLNC